LLVWVFRPAIEFGVWGWVLLTPLTALYKNGNKSITWTSFNKPKQFTKGTDSTTFTYGPDRSRYQKVQTRSSDNTTITKAA
jgi:hypothetical protein